MFSPMTIKLSETIRYENPEIPLGEVDIDISPSTKQDHLDLIGGLSRTTKMPGYSYSISAFRCNVGRSLRTVEGSTCRHCYACKGNYVRYPQIQKALERRYQSLFNPEWTATFIDLLRRWIVKGHPYFRWHDSGDLQSLTHLQNIVTIARCVPKMKFWLPTREYQLVDKFLETDSFPRNLNVRVSAHMINRMAPSRFTVTSGVLGRHTSVEEVLQKNPNVSFSVCPAPDQGGKCGDCRSCWNSEVSTVFYKEH